MKLKSRFFFSAILLVLGFFCFSSAKAQQFKVLLYTKTAGFHHSSIHEGVIAMRRLAERHSFSLEWHEDANIFNEKKLAEFQAVVFLNTTGDILNADQQKAFEKFIQSGKGFVGVHSAADTEYDWEWYTKLVGRMFVIHPVNQTAVLNVKDYNFPGLERFPASYFWTDEWYEYGEEKIKGLNYILTVDEKTFNPNVQWGQKVGKGMGDFHPIAWYHEYDGGRAFYTGLGHISGIYQEPLFLEHLYGAIYWAATGKGIKKSK
jgi:type 1 glutamine amidotransferase